MVADGDERALRVCGVETAGGVGQDQRSAAEQTENAGGEGDLVHRVALVGVHAAGHHGNLSATDCPQDELPRVTFHGGLRPVRDVCVGDDGGCFNMLCEVAKA